MSCFKCKSVFRASVDSKLSRLCKEPEHYLIMESKYDDIIVELKKLGGIQRHGRICKSKNGGITFESETFVTPFKRYWNGDSRYQAVDDISATLKKAFDETRLMLNSKYLCSRVSQDAEDLASSDEDERRQILERLTIMYHCLDKAIDGINNICQTYSDDKETVTRMCYMADKIKRRLGDIELKCPSVVAVGNKNFTTDE